MQQKYYCKHNLNFFTTLLHTFTQWIDKTYFMLNIYNVEFY
jgi:hypothetical protein